MKALALNLARSLGFEKYLFLIFDWARMLLGYLVFLIKKNTPSWTYRSFIRLFCLTQGRSNDFLSSLISKVHPPVKIPVDRGLLPIQSENQAKNEARKIEQMGYITYPSLMPKDVCDQLKQIALTEPGWVRPIDVGTEKKYHDKKVHAVYDSKEPIGIRYDYFAEQLIKYPVIQKIVTDPSILNLAQAYLKSEPILDSVNMWWCTAYAKAPSAEAAQMYHFDLERPRWLKIFVYLTDVDSDSGPHCFVAKTHRSGAIPQDLLERGYARILDEEVAAVYPREDILSFTGPVGTLIAEDTRGLHKGKNLKHGERLVFQIQYSNTLFVIDSPQVKVPKTSVTDEFSAVYQQQGRVLSRFHIV